ncbi:hypothetical protein FXF68_25950 [Actinomadura decatromicini]|uniref:Uncharacterized protein n=1 Tax=Actinomadura decatromicini TaxID=2604572 RepID=A0A5D3FGJ8_9ACTN|nr:hypothetical protein FXF68_25950 [Actinomadura decatromicini]
MIESATRELHKGTLVPLRLPSILSFGQAMAKLGFVQRLGLRPGEVEDAARRLREMRAEAGSMPDATALELLGSFEEPGVPHLLQAAQALAGVPVEALLGFGRAVVELRRGDLERITAERGGGGEAAGAAHNDLHGAVLAVKGLEISTDAHGGVGALNLERLEMTPAGIERGELVGTVPLAPLEQTAVTQKEWSVQKKEFTSIVTDSLETLSETGVTDNTELSQSTNSQQEHSNQFNVTGTVSGGIPVISGSVTSSFTGQGKESESATESRKHATGLTQKASSRAKQEHKVTIATTTVTGTSQTTTRTLRNPNDTNPIRVDYYSMMRKWRVRLYRYGLRSTYDIVLPEPASSMRRAYVELTALKARLGPFVFDLPHSDITADIRTGDPKPPVTDPPTPDQPHYLVLADRYHAPAPPPPPAPTKIINLSADDLNLGVGRHSGKVTVNVPPNYRIASILMNASLEHAEHDGRFTVMGTNISFDPFGHHKDYVDFALFAHDGSTPFLLNATESQPIRMLFEDVNSATITFTVRCVPTNESMDQWRADVWNGFYNAAQAQYFAEQQDIAGKIAALEERLTNVDTLTLRREENDEVMKGVLRYLLGTRFPTMPGKVLAAFEKANVDVTHGTAFETGAIKPDAEEWTLVRQYEEIVRFVNQAIEWENVVTFLYSYFWDIPASWDFIRQLEHPDATRQAFLRAGSARIVLTVRRGWETRWANFVDRGLLDDPREPDPESPYWTIAQEIAAYDDRNYPGIPPANPGKTATRLEDAVITTSPVSVSPSTGPVAIQVAASAGFLVGAQVVIDSVRGLDHNQEAQTIVEIPDATHIKVGKLTKAHTGTAASPFSVVQPGEKGELIAEWNEYTPTSGIDITVTYNPAQGA